MSGEVLTKFVIDAVSSKVSLLVTDEWIGYQVLSNQSDIDCQETKD